jgi:hypothetical protein
VNARIDGSNPAKKSGANLLQSFYNLSRYFFAAKTTVVCMLTMILSL